MQPFSDGSSGQNGPFVSCPNCGLTNPPQARFCANCGHPFIQLAPGQPAPGQPAPFPQGTPPPPPSFSPSNQWVPAPPQPAFPGFPSLSKIAREPRPFPVRQPVSPAPQQFPGNLVELWWVRIPVALRRHSLLLSEVWHDGVYLTVVPQVAWLLPVLMFLSGVVEGFTHWALMVNQPGTEGLVVSFTELLPFMIFAAVIGTFSANLGLMITFGYALGDIVNTALTPEASFSPDLSSTPLATLFNIYAPHLVSYLVLGLLAVTPTLTARFLTLWLYRLIRLQLLRAFLQTALGACVIGGVLFGWTQATPMMIRVYWGWGWNSIFTPVAGMFYLQQPDTGNLIVQAAVLAFVVRGILMYPAAWNRSASQYAARLQRGLKKADAHPGWLRKLPSFLRSLVPAAVTTLLLGGIVTDIREFWFIFLFLWFLLVLRGTILPLFGFWTTWAKLLNYVPAVARLAIALFFIYLSATQLVIVLWTQTPLFADTPSSSFEPFLLTAGISAIIIMVLMPQAKQVKSVRVPPQIRPAVKSA